MTELTREQLLDVGVEASKRSLPEVLEELMAARGIEDLEELHRRFLETEYAYIPIPGGHRGKPVPFEEFKQHVENRYPKYHYRQVIWGLSEVLGATRQEKMALVGSYMMGPPGSFRTSDKA